jgi:hypothetical protein
MVALRNLSTRALPILACAAAIAAPVAAQQPPPSTGPLLVLGASVREGNSGVTPLRFTIAMRPGPGAPATLTLSYRTDGGTASPGSDYNATQGSVTLSPQHPLVQVSVDVLGDTVEETPESIGLLVEDPATQTLARGLGFILDDDGTQPPPPPPFPAAVVALDSVVREPPSGAVDGSLTVLRVGPANAPLSLAFAVGADSTATADVDYQGPASGSVDFAAGERLKRVVWRVLADSEVEAPESIRVQFSAPAGIVMPRPVATLRIVEGGPLQPPPRAAVGIIACRHVVHEDEGSARFIVRRFGDVGAALSVDYTSEDGNAVAGEDYTATTGTLAWAAGESDPRAIDVPVLPDDVVEPAERFGVRLANAPSTTVLAPARAGVVVLDSRDDVFTDDFAGLCEDTQTEIP